MLVKCTTSMSYSTLPFFTNFVNIPLLNSSNGFSPSVGVIIVSLSISMLLESWIFLKLTASAPCPCCGIIGGWQCRRRAHWVFLKNGWALTSDAPALEPSRRFSSLHRSLRINDLHRLYWFRKNGALAITEKSVGDDKLPICHLLDFYLEICWYPPCSGNMTSFRIMFTNVTSRVAPLNGVKPYWI